VVDKVLNWLTSPRSPTSPLPICTFFPCSIDSYLVHRFPFFFKDRFDTRSPRRTSSVFLKEYNCFPTPLQYCPSLLRILLFLHAFPPLVSFKARVPSEHETVSTSSYSSGLPKHGYFIPMRRSPLFDPPFPTT